MPEHFLKLLTWYARSVCLPCAALRHASATGLQAQGHAVGRWRIRRVLKPHGLRAQQPRSFVPRTTDSDPAVRAAPNRLLGQPAPIAPNRVWVGDSTYLPR